MAVLYECPTCHKMVSGRARDYGSLCDECSGRNAAKLKEAARWAALPVDQKVEELKKRVDEMGQATQHSWYNGPIG